MRYLITSFCIVVILAKATTGFSQVEGMVYIQGGVFTPPYSSDSTQVEAGPFYLDVYPVTNAEYFQFLQEQPAWRKENVKPIFADKGYLKHWTLQVKQLSDLQKIKDKPVVNVSWFSAKRYCECQGKRLPTVNEWEYVALASATEPVGAKNPEFYQKILDWYSKPSKTLPADVGSTFKNYHGVYDIYGLVWEWVIDFNTAMASGRLSSGADLNNDLFCGSGGAGAADPNDYVAFMRNAFRSSLKANYTVGNLGFRCAKDK
jgi:formylglycine-generating enzyme required for sulfatase activity